MGETLATSPEGQDAATRPLGRMTILEALAEPSEGVSVDMSRRSTQMGNGVDAEDD